MKIYNSKHLGNFSRTKTNVDKEGWLSKKGELNTSYQKRWCILKGNLLFYFEKKNDTSPIGVIVLENCSVQLAEGGDSPFTFSIQFNGQSTRTYKLTADDDFSCNSWMKALLHSSYMYMQILVNEMQREVDKTGNKEDNEKINSPPRHLDVLNSIDVVDGQKNNLFVSNAPKSKSSILRKISPKFGRKAHAPHKNSVRLSNLMNLRQDFKTLHLKYRNEIFGAAKNETNQKQTEIELI